MKLSTRDANAFLARPDTRFGAVLIYGADAMRVALKRQDLVAALAGPGADEEMRLTRLPAADLRKDTAALTDAAKAVGFFPGQRVVFVEDATDGLAPVFEATLEDLREGDAVVVATAGQLTPRGALRKLFEKHPRAAAIAIYDDPPDRAEVEQRLKAAGVAEVSREGAGALMDLARELSPGDFRQTVDKLALYKLGDPAPVSPDDVAAIAPATVEAAVDDLLHAVAEKRSAELAPLFMRLKAQGTNAVTLCIQALRHFRALHAAAADPGGASSGIAKLRPPVPWKARDRMIRQATAWGLHDLEAALALLTETDLALRSTSRAPQMALMERILVRLAMGGRR